MSHRSTVCVRQRIVWRPEWNETFESWTKYFVSSNRWRREPYLDFDDLMQEARELFYKLAEYYPRIIDPPHFMSIYKRSIQNIYHDHARLRRHFMHNLELGLMAEEASTPPEERIGEVTNPGYMVTLLNELPNELQLVLTTLATGRYRLKLKKHGKSIPLRERESLNKKLCRTLGLQTTTDPVGDLYRFFTT